MDKCASTRSNWKGFEIVALRNAAIQVKVVPALGAKIVSLKNLRTGREWMWHRGDCLELFENKTGDDFSRGPLVGWDECLPTIAPCAWKGRSLPDHGEVWSVPWELAEDYWKRGMIRTSVQLAVSPFQFSRTLEVQASTLAASYHLVNLGDTEQEFLWAMHPLLNLRQGDRLELTEEVRQQLQKQTWIDSLEFGKNSPACSKVFAGPLTAGRAAVANSLSGDQLSFCWSSADCNMLGIWLTRGGWHGHHHLALEPCNGKPDALEVAAKSGNCGTLPPHGEKKWQVEIRLTP